ncbi:ABC transporter ATP-binding protein [Pectinatus sottacetonis]|uniref:ABC transporter ATP-binding protein n=1 Tax=Pectinatus sottacetonis TaxID=1002795 RepID=UPI001E5F9350|nr:ABC transporter ATP-binding protein [Pectinatus sottacetonis]
MLRLCTLKKVFSYKNALGKTDDKIAVDNLNLQINNNEIFGLLGPNGAGKTTTIRMLTMLTKPTSGKIYYDNLTTDENPKNIKGLIGVVPQHINFDQDLTIGENMHLHGRLHHMTKQARVSRINELLSYVELSDRINDSVRSLSGGMQRRLLIVRALMHKPSILFLDEPTVALDPQVRRRIWDLIRKMHQLGVTIVLTTHYIEEAESLCGRVAIMNRGKLIALDSPDNLKEKIGQYVVEWDNDNAERNFKIFQNKKAAQTFAAQLQQSNILQRRSNLEDVFVELTGKKVNN